MVLHTNEYARQYFENNTNFRQYSRLHIWNPVTTEDMNAFVALQIAMGINSKPEIEDCWGTFWLTQNSFCDVMSRNKYELMCTFLHFNDNSTRVARGEDGYDPLHKVCPMIDIVDPTYQAVYSPKNELALDESMISTRGGYFSANTCRQSRHNGE